MRFSAEPVAWLAFVRACLLVGMAFGLGWSETQIASVMLAVELALALILRRQVTSDATAVDAGTSTNELKRVADNVHLTMVPRLKSDALR